MPSLPKITGADNQKLNAGPRHAKVAQFSNGLHDRFWRDESLDACRRQDQTDKANAERQRRRRMAAEDTARRREKRLKTLERRMRDDERRVRELEEKVRGRRLFASADPAPRRSAIRR